MFALWQLMRPAQRLLRATVLGRPHGCTTPQGPQTHLGSLWH
jgi:hypothetical protein